MFGIFTIVMIKFLQIRFKNSIEIKVIIINMSIIYNNVSLKILENYPLVKLKFIIYKRAIAQTYIMSIIYKRY